MDLENNKTDTIASAIKGSLSAIPYIGSLVAELFCIYIPHQRMDRVTKFIKILANKVECLEQSKIETVFKDPKFIDLLEDATWQSTKAISDERIEKIAQLLSNGIMGEKIEHEKFKRYLFLLNQLTDSELVKLGGFYYPNQGNSEYYSIHKDILQNPPPSFASPPEQIENFAINESHIQHLNQLGLIEAHYNVDRELGIPEFDRITGQMKPSGFQITALGKNLLKYIENPN
ncbi:TPA: hypothetical protein JBD38_13345 [Legionella pneumophila subsp. pneumophila]|nr:hypothetical protein [Legionella pneumophila]MDW8922585.1 hypothetical protein [Legionella pneumophila]MDW8928730.1 hypothetical protein [Legionella pneumophila]MDX1866558.1 hypothetical protein [Legionella pneumophila]HAT9621354.1 hypothetical protein [Legionella pneumophila subsp. pneumophila]